MTRGWQSYGEAEAVPFHMIDSFLYLPDYPIGHMIAFQIEEQMG